MLAQHADPGRATMVIPMDMPLPSSSSPETAFRVSPQAAIRLQEIIAAQPGADATSNGLRVSVLAGGCNGFQYSFALDGEARPDDIVVPAGSARVLVDPASLDLLSGAELHFNDSLMGAHFTVRNPNATSSCGCGTSFSID
ncbi:iron-sulfur cluster insertion protein ErpA [Gluconacetobacter tumulicola]